MEKHIICKLSLSIILSTLVFQNLAFPKSENEKVKRVLTLEEVELANEARAEVARVVEKNLVRFFTLVLSADENGVNRIVHQRQDEDDIEEAAPTLDPTILPQVSQILGAVFSGAFNVTNVIDQTFTLVPAPVKDQIKGLFQLLTGQKPDPVTATVTPAKQKQKVATTQSSQTSTETIVVETTTEKNSQSKHRYKVNRIRTTPAPNSTHAIVLLPDDENETIFVLEEELVKNAIEEIPYVRNKKPMDFKNSFNAVLNRIESENFNFTNINKIVPNLFQGATNALNYIEKIGEIESRGSTDDSVVRLLIL